MIYFIKPWETLFYELDDEIKDKLELLAQLRILGEDKYAETSNERGVLIKWFTELIGESQTDIEDFCKSNIDYIVNKCKKLDIYVSPKYKNSYLY